MVQAHAPLRVGVIGHRRIVDEARLRALIDEVFDELGDHGLAVWSSLAEGADRIGAEAALDRNVPLHAVLPMPAEDYERDFPSTAVAFYSLLERAASVRVVEQTANRNEAYLEAGLQVLASTDVLVVAWNGEAAAGKGGTADVVAQARRSGQPMVWVRAENGKARPATPGPDLTYERMEAVGR
jgi:hypothetical protein